MRAIGYRSLTHAYVMHEHFAREVVAMPWEQEAYDAMLRRLGRRYFVLYPSFAFQSNSPTDNIRYLKLDRFRRLSGGLCRIQRMNECFYRNKGLIVMLHLIGVLMLAALALVVL